jgi:hypothetical protein
MSVYHRSVYITAGPPIVTRDEEIEDDEDEEER